MTVCEKVKELVEQGWKLVDVRTPQEFNQSRILGAENVQMHDVPNLDQSEKYLLYCRSGARSGMAEMHLKRSGVEALNIGGINQFIGCIEH